MKNLSGIILAAGQGKRLGKQIPKGLLKRNGKFLIENIIDLLISENIHDIYIITGYKKYLIENIQKKYNFKLNFIHSYNWKNSNMLESLICANQILKKNNCIISYSDIFYEIEAIKILKKSKSHICVLSNNNWKKYWKKRFKNPLDDLESFSYNKLQYLTEIGSKVKNINDIQGQFMGLLRIQTEGWKEIKKILQTFDKSKISNLDITNLLSILIREKKKIKIKKYSKPWFEFDFSSDIRLLNV